MPLNPDDNDTSSVFTSKLTHAADICVGLAILTVGMCFSVLLRDRTVRSYFTLTKADWN